MNVPQNLKTEEEWQSVRHFLRPVMVSLIECKNVWLQGVIFQNSPAWNLHPLMCENVLIEEVQVRNPSYAQNGDGGSGILQECTDCETLHLMWAMMVFV